MPCSFINFCFQFHLTILAQIGLILSHTSWYWANSALATSLSFSANISYDKDIIKDALQLRIIFLSTSIYGPTANQVGRELKWKTQCAITVKTGKIRFNSKMYITSLGNLLELGSTTKSWAVHNLQYSP